MGNSHVAVLMPESVGFEEILSTSHWSSMPMVVFY